MVGHCRVSAGRVARNPLKPGPEPPQGSVPGCDGLKARGWIWAGAAPGYPTRRLFRHGDRHALFRYSSMNLPPGMPVAEAFTTVNRTVSHTGSQAPRSRHGIVTDITAIHWLKCLQYQRTSLLRSIIACQATDATVMPVPPHDETVRDKHHASRACVGLVSSYRCSGMRGQSVVEAHRFALTIIAMDVESLFRTLHGRPIPVLLLRRWSVEYDRRLQALRHGRDAQCPRYMPGDPLRERDSFVPVCRATGVVCLKRTAEAARPLRVSLLTYTGSRPLTQVRWEKWKLITSQATAIG